MSNFNFNCPVPITNETPTVTECGVEKTVSWSSTGVHLSGTTFFLKYSDLTNLKKVYVTKDPTLSKFIKVVFTPVNMNGASTIVYFKQKINGVDTLVFETNLGTLSGTTNKYFSFLIPEENKSDIFFTVDFKTTGGSSGSFKIKIECDPIVHAEEFCSGYSFQTGVSCSECPQTITLYSEQTPGWSVAPYINSPWYTNVGLTNEVSDGEILMPKIYYNGTVNYKTYFIYNSTAHKLSPQSCGGGDEVNECGASIVTTQITAGSAKEPHPYYRNTPNVKVTGLKYGIVDFFFTLESNHRVVPVTITSTGPNEGVFATVGDGSDITKVGKISFLNPLQTSVTNTWQRYEPTSNTTLFKLTNVLGVNTLNRNFITTTGVLHIRVAVAYKKDATNNDNNPTNINVTVGCGQEIYKTLVGVHPYSAYDAINNPKIQAYVYSLQANGGGVNGSLYTDELLTYGALPYYYGVIATNNVLKVGKDIIKREFGTKTDYKFKSRLFASLKVITLNDGPKDFTYIPYTNTFSTNSSLTPTYDRATLSAIKPVMPTYGTINYVYDGSTLNQPSVYSYYVGFTNSTYYLANNEAFTAYDYGSQTHIPLNGPEHILLKFFNEYRFASQNSLFLSKYETRATESDGLITGGAVFIAAGAILLKVYGAAALTGPLGIIAGIILTIIGIIFGVNTTRIENSKILRKRYSTTPFLKPGNTIYKHDDLTTGNEHSVTPYENYYTTICDGDYFYTISSSGVITNRERSTAWDLTVTPNIGRGSADTFKIDTVSDSTSILVDDFGKLFLLCYIMGRPEKYTTPVTKYKSSAVTYTITQSTSTVGELNNPLPINITLPEGFFESETSTQDADDKLQDYLASLTGNTIDTQYTYSEKPGVKSIETYFTHEIKIEDIQNTFVLFYDDSDSGGVTIGKKLYYDVDGDSTVLNGYYSVSDGSNYRKFYKTTNGTVVDIITWVNSGDTTANGTSTTYNVSTINLDYTSGWFVTSQDDDDLKFNVYSSGNELIMDWNTSSFYNNPLVVRGFINNFNTKDSFYLYDNNTTQYTYTEAQENLYRQIYPFDSEIFNYDLPNTLIIDFEEVCSEVSDNGVTFKVKDTAGNDSTTFVGTQFVANIYTGSSVLYSAVTINLAYNESEKFVALPNVGFNEITNVTIDSFISDNPFLKTTFSGGTYTECTAPTLCDYYSGTTYIVDSYGFIEYLNYDFTPVYEEVFEGIYTINTGIVYGSLRGSTRVQDEFNVANIRILDYGDCFTLPTPTPTPTNTVTPTVTPTLTPTPTTVCEFGLSVVVLTPTPTPTATNTPTPTLTPTLTPTNTVTPTVTQTQTPTPTTVCEFGLSVAVLTPTPTPTPTITPSPSPNYPPTDISLSNSSINENTATGTTIGTFTSTSLDSGDTYTYTLVSGIGDTDNSSFIITSASLKNATIPNYEVKTSYSIRVRSTDGIGQYIEKQFTITVNNVNETPYALSLSNTSQVENTVTGTTIGTFSTSDVDSGDTFTYSLVSGTGDADNASFTISGTSLKNAIVFNYESKSSYSIRVRTTDANGLYYEGTFTITVTNENEAPTDIILSSYSVSENVPTGTTVGTFSTTDPEGGSMTYEFVDTVTYPDNNSFTIVSGVLKTAVIFNYEVKNSYSIKVRVTDSTGLTYTEVITISITDVTISATLTGTNITCYNGNTGQIVVSDVVGGTANYTYSKDGTNYQVSDTFSSLTAGTYTIYIKDTYGEVGTVNKTLTQSSQITATIDKTDVTCNGVAEGTIMVSSFGGGQGGPYSVKLNSGGTYQVTTTSRTYSNLTAGTYTIYVKDSADCERTYSTTITQPNALSVSASVTHPTCYGDSNGSITVSASGGYGNLQLYYALSSNYGSTYTTNQTSNVFNNLPAGSSYIVRVEEDITGCVKTYGPITLAKSAVTTTLTPTHLTCYGQNSDGIYAGSVSIAYPSGGNSSSYQYKLGSGGTYTNWSAGTTVVWGNLRGGVKTVYIRDAQNCEFTFTTTVNEPTQVTASVSASNPACYGGTGSITVTSLSGGSGTGYQVKLGSGGTYESFSSSKTYSSLAGGTYTVYVKDSLGCENTYSSTVTVPSQVTVATSSVTYTTCYNGSNGSVTLTASGGNGSYQYRINSGTWVNSATFSTLGATSYTFQSRDTAGCESSSITVDMTKTAPNCTRVVTNVSCNGGSNGSIATSSPLGGNSGVYTVSIDGTTYHSFPKTFDSLTAGNYTIYVKDYEGCVQSYAEAITQPTAQSALISEITNPPCGDLTGGSFNVSSTGGVWPKTYRLYEDETSPYNTCGGTLVATYTNVQSGAAVRTPTGLSSGGYCLEVTDANGCVTNSGVTVLTDGVSYYRYQVIRCSDNAYMTITSPDELPSSFITGTAAVKIDNVCYQIDYLFDTVCSPGSIHLTDGQYSSVWTSCSSCTSGGIGNQV